MKMDFMCYIYNKVYMKKGTMVVTGILAMIFSLLTACSVQDAIPDNSLVDDAKSITLAIGTKPMLQLNSSTRASKQMAPEMENCIKTLDVFQFDTEGNHDRKTGYSHREFVDDGNPTGVLETTITEKLLPNMRTLCVLANVPQEQISAFYVKVAGQTGQTVGRVTFDDIKQWAVRFNYIQRTDDASVDSAGMVRQMYMFGYYDGVLPSGVTGDKLQIVLGRLTARLDITINNKSSQQIAANELLYHFDNVPVESYVFPGNASMKPDVVDDAENYMLNTEALEPNKGSFTRYFYVGENVAKSPDEATYLHLFYKKGGFAEPGKVVKGGKKIALCNSSPSDIESGKNESWQLHRNTIYSVTINLVDASDTSSSAAAKIRTRAGATPGEIVYDVPIACILGE